MSFGVIVGTRTNPAARGPVVDSGTLFLVGPTGGEYAAVEEVRSLDDFEAVWGGRVGATVPTWDAVDAYLREGGTRVIVAPYNADFGDGLTLLSDKKLGLAGQLAVVGVAPSATLYTDMQSHGRAYNRVALRDVRQADTIAQMEADGDLAPENDDQGATFGPWAVIPGPAGVVGAGPRQVPASVVVAALCNRVDQDGNPNRAAAGADYRLRYVNDLALPISDADRSNLFGHGVNALNDVWGNGQDLENYGFQTNIQEDPTNPYWQFNCVRGRMYLVARAQVRGQPYMFRTIDGRGVLGGALQSDIEDECKQLYDRDAFYASDGTPQSAYSARVTETLTEVAQGVLHAEADVVWSMHTKEVRVDLVTIPIGTSPSP